MARFDRKENFQAAEMKTQTFVRCTRLKSASIFQSRFSRAVSLSLSSRFPFSAPEGESYCWASSVSV